ncbi:hypothetical protein B9Z19DRAFT_1125442 [Tuber borchii]|uniref:Uncharacterized protein n=1 Tax=Tuber borchii TaxID=42251 RepID=A0A2T6ZUT7_TUBBO|nr:hypothetical protein B9Z19DRAFT_1125442 [Tuber borchii]
MVKFKSELASSPDTPPMHGVIKRDDSADKIREAVTSEELPRTSSQTPAHSVRPPQRTTSSKRKDGSEKRILHGFPNEEHRFIEFYRADLECSLGDTYVDFNEYFGPHYGFVRTLLKIPTRGSGRNAQRKFVRFHIPSRVQPEKTMNTAGQVITLAIEDTEDDTEEENESSTHSTDEGMSTQALAGREQGFRTHIGVVGETSIKKSNSEPRQNRVGILTSNSSSPKSKAKRRSSYHVNENRSPVSNSYTSTPPIGRAAGKRKFEFHIGFDSNEYSNEGKRDC